MANRLPAEWTERMALPVIAAPMFLVSGPDLVIATCKAGVIGAFPTQNPKLLGDPAGLDGWLERMFDTLGRDKSAFAPICPNLIMRTDDLGAHVDSVLRFGVEMVITSVGSPKPILGRLHDAGVFVFADVATVEHARKAIEVGVDGLVLLTAGAGGQTGWLNPFAYVRAVRAMFDGPIVLAGGMSDGVALLASQVLGCDLAYMGTKLIATHESLASSDYGDALVAASMDDIMLTKAFTGLSGSYLRQTIVAAGLDPDNLDESVSEARAREAYGARSGGAKRWTDIKSAGHSVSGVTAVTSVAEVIADTQKEYRAAAAAMAARFT